MSDIIYLTKIQLLRPKNYLKHPIGQFVSSFPQVALFPTSCSLLVAFSNKDKVIFKTNILSLTIYSMYINSMIIVYCANNSILNHTRIYKWGKASGNCTNMRFIFCAWFCTYFFWKKPLPHRLWILSCYYILNNTDAQEKCKWFLTQ